MFLYYIPFPILIKSAISACDKTDTDAFVFFLSGRKEADLFNKELTKNWEYIDDLTSDSIIVFTPNIEPSQKVEWREWAGRAAFVKNGNFSKINTEWNNAFYNTNFKDSKNLISLFDIKAIFDFDFHGIKREKTLKKRQNKINFITQQTKEIANHLCIDEEYLPCFLFFSVKERELFIISISENVSFYEIVKEIMNFYSPISNKRKKFEKVKREKLLQKNNFEFRHKNFNTEKKRLNKEWIFINNIDKGILKNGILSFSRDIISSLEDENERKQFIEYHKKIKKTKDISDIITFLKNNSDINLQKIYVDVSEKIKSYDNSSINQIDKLKTTLLENIGKIESEIITINKKLNTYISFSKTIITTLKKLDFEIEKHIVKKNILLPNWKYSICKYNNNIQPNQTIDNFDIIVDICNKYQQEVENNGQLREIQINEKNIQENFYRFIVPYCDIHKIKIIREPKIDLGKVDFQFITNKQEIIHIEIKLTTNPNLNAGLTEQLETYNRAVQTIKSIYFVFNTNNKDLKRLYAIWGNMKQPKPKLITVNVNTSMIYPSKMKYKT